MFGEHGNVATLADANDVYKELRDWSLQYSLHPGCLLRIAKSANNLNSGYYNFHGNDCLELLEDGFSYLLKAIRHLRSQELEPNEVFSIIVTWSKNSSWVVQKLRAAIEPDSIPSLEVRSAVTAALENLSKRLHSITDFMPSATEYEQR